MRYHEITTEGGHMRMLVRNAGLMLAGAALLAGFVGAGYAIRAMGQEAGTVDTVQVAEVNLRNAVFEIVPVGLTQSWNQRNQHASNLSEPPYWWAEHNGQRWEYQTRLFGMQVDVRNLTANTLSGPYWTVAVANQVNGEWYPVGDVLFRGRTVAPGRSEPVNVQATIHPDTTAVRFTLTYQEP